MVNYIEKVTASDLSPAWPNTTLFDNVMSVGVGTDTFVTLSGMGGVVESASFITPAGVPNSDAWEDGGTQTVEIEVDTASADIDVRVRIVRLNSAGVIQESGSFTGIQTLAATRTFSPVAPTWTGPELCEDRIAIELEISYNAAHGSATADIGLGTVANEVITDITEDSAGCTATAALSYPLTINAAATMAIAFVAVHVVDFLSKIGLMAKPCKCKKKRMLAIMNTVK